MFPHVPALVGSAQLALRRRRLSRRETPPDCRDMGGRTRPMFVEKRLLRREGKQTATPSLIPGAPPERDMPVGWNPQLED